MVSAAIDRFPLGLGRSHEIARRPAFLARISEKPKAVTPEAVKAVGVRLNERLGVLKTDFTKLESDLAKGNCIRLDCLNFDYPAEIERHEKAVTALSFGKTELAHNLLEQQVRINMVRMEEMTMMAQGENAEYKQLTGDMAKTKGKLRVSLTDKMRYSNDDAVLKEIYKGIGEKLDREHPEWQKMAKDEYLKLKDAEIQRNFRLRQLYSPRALTEYVKTALDQKAKISHKQMYIELRFAEMQALTEHRDNLASSVGARDQIELENMDLDGELAEIGGSRIGDLKRHKDRQQYVAAKLAEKKADPERALQAIMGDEKGDLKAADGKMVATAQLMNMQQTVLARELLQVKDKKSSQRINQVRARITMLRNSLQQIWDRAREVYKSQDSIQWVSTFPLETIARLHEPGVVDFAALQKAALSSA